LNKLSLEGVLQNQFKIVIEPPQIEIGLALRMTGIAARKSEWLIKLNQQLHSNLQFELKLKI